MAQLIALVTRLREEEQHDSVVRLLEILIEHPNKNEQYALDSQTKSHLSFLFAESLLADKHYARAFRAFTHTLVFKEEAIVRRASKRIKSIQQPQHEFTSIDIETKFRISQSLAMLDNFAEALKIVEEIPKHSRSIKILSHLADLYMRDKDSLIKANDVYLEILKLEPLSMSSIVSLLEIGRVNYDDIVENIPEDVREVLPWYLTWIHAQYYLHKYELWIAAESFENLLTNHFVENPALLTEFAEAHYRNRNYSLALTKLAYAFEKDPLLFKHMDTYAACLFKESKLDELEDLCEKVTFLSSNQATFFPELWLVSAYYNFGIEMHERALLFAQKSYDINKNHVETLVILAALHLDRQEPMEANKYIFHAYKLASYRFDVRNLICRTYIARKDHETACAIAKLTLTDWNQSDGARDLFADIKAECEENAKNSE